MEIENEHLENQKKIKKFEPVFSLRTGRLVRLDRRFKRSNPGSVSIRSNDRTELEQWPVGSPTGWTDWQSNRSDQPVRSGF